MYTRNRVGIMALSLGRIIRHVAPRQCLWCIRVPQTLIEPLRGSDEGGEKRSNGCRVIRDDDGYGGVEFHVR